MRDGQAEEKGKKIISEYFICAENKEVSHSVVLWTGAVPYLSRAICDGDGW